MNNYHNRFYRDFGRTKRWNAYRVAVETTDLYIKTFGDYSSLTEKMVRYIRDELKKHILRQPEFLTSLTPVDILENIHPVILKMNKAAQKTGVGPMAAVAGAVAEFVGLELMLKSDEAIVENGGDIFLKLTNIGVNGIFAGDSPFSGKIGIKVYPEKTPISICTSSGTVGHSYSRGMADAAVIIAKDACLADAAATGTANLITSEKNFKKALDYALNIEGILGAVLIFKDKLAAKGDIEFVSI